ncbi:hypothetical protein Despr_0914 [Desulfobulbus propionicus DSM 2032]|uniref:Peptidase C51 domain-containing protein n=1 Tax=Desulfobulbus propionicus (strain ATCC 33891 / DSM 2032 / VKM B-1956 / 1pr3) TaxID=577650 RepID=A0A7U3YKJ8_DESPD|nr:CHAP domain-containing protein [Desulfobulbus propionicus]ADW17088.1 hypothetical protein Despr_0914 [Desulfobulbus propionicus DSM 2032]
MHRSALNTALFLASALLLFCAGCSPTKHSAATQQSPPTQAHRPTADATDPAAAASTAGEAAREASASPVCASPEQLLNSERNRDACYHLRPAKTMVVKKTVKQSRPSNKASKKTAGKTTKGKAAKVAVKQKKKAAAATTRVVTTRTVGLCQPQSLIYARCRTGITTCRLGNTSPVQWFACARANSATSAMPAAGSVIVLDANTGRNMPTGHPAYVEEVRNNPDGTWTLRISHTNYDRQCHLDQDATVLFDPRRMTASFESGPWGPWAKNLKVLGFILR